MAVSRHTWCSTSPDPRCRSRSRVCLGERRPSGAAFSLRAGPGSPWLAHLLFISARLGYVLAARPQKTPPGFAMFESNLDDSPTGKVPRRAFIASVAAVGAGL